MDIYENEKEKENETMSNYIMILLLIILGYMMVYALVDRVCKCKEQIALVKAFGEYQKYGAEDVEKLTKMVNEFTEKYKSRNTKASN